METVLFIGTDVALAASIAAVELLRWRKDRKAWKAAAQRASR